MRITTILLTLLLMGGCTANSHDISRGVSLCANHGGLYELYLAAREVKCEDETEIHL